jgi:hypothetical protein
VGLGSLDLIDWNWYQRGSGYCMSALELHATGAVLESVSAELLLCGTTSGGYTATSCLACNGGTDWLCVGGMSCPGMPCWGDFGKEHKSGVGTQKWIFLRTEAWYSTRSDSALGTLCKSITHLGFRVARGPTVNCHCRAALFTCSSFIRNPR